MSFLIPDSFLKNDVPTRQNNINEEDSDLPTTLDEVRSAYSQRLMSYFYVETKLSEELLALHFKVLLLNILDDPTNQKK